MGLNATQAITLFYRQIEINRGLPFLLRVPNETTRQTLDNNDCGKNLVYRREAGDLLKRLKL